MSGTCWCHYQYKSNIQPFLFSPCFYNFTPNCFEALLTLRLLAYGWLWVLETLALATFLLLAFFFPCLSVWSGLLLLLVFENCTFKIWNFELDFFKYGKKIHVFSASSIPENFCIIDTFKLYPKLLQYLMAPECATREHLIWHDQHLTAHHSYCSLWLPSLQYLKLFSGFNTCFCKNSFV